MSTKKLSCILSLGSNKGNRVMNLNNGLAALEKRLYEFNINKKQNNIILSTSHIYETVAMEMDTSGSNDRPFLNACCEVSANGVDARDLLDILKSIEQNDFGRDVNKAPTKGYLQRNLDLDILFWNVDRHHKNQLAGEILSFNGENDKRRHLVVPHPRLHQRDFVLEPLNDIGSDLMHPIVNKTISNLLQSVKPTSFPKQVLGFTAYKDKEHVIPLFDAKGNRNMAVMGILNITPDSFSDGGDNIVVENAMKMVDEMLDNGAKIIDIGAESTRPNAELISEEEEMRRLLPILTAMRDKFSNSNTLFSISLDTTKSAVARKLLEQKLIHIINDISGARFDPKILQVAKEYGVPIILMHSRGDPKTMVNLTSYGDEPNSVMKELKNQFTIMKQAAIDNGIPNWNIILDPGIGFAKNQEQNYRILTDLPQLVQNLQRSPILIGASRKRFLDVGIQSKDAKSRDWATCTTTVAAYLGGASLVRVHNVPANMQSLLAAKNIWKKSN